MRAAHGENHQALLVAKQRSPHDRLNRFQSLSEIPAATSESEIISKDLKSRGFKFVGPTIVYAHMQATGMVNDHTVDCFRYRQVRKQG